METKEFFHLCFLSFEFVTIIIIMIQFVDDI